MRGCDFYFIFFSKKDLLLDKLKKMNCFIYIFCYKVSDFFFFLLMYRLVQREQHIYRELYIQIQILIFSTFITKRHIFRLWRNMKKILKILWDCVKRFMFLILIYKFGWLYFSRIWAIWTGCLIRTFRWEWKVPGNNSSLDNLEFFTDSFRNY